MAPRKKKDPKRRNKTTPKQKKRQYFPRKKVNTTKETIVYLDTSPPCIRDAQYRKEVTYLGITNDLVRRLKQHNGMLKGGSKYVQRNMNEYLTNVFFIGGFKLRADAARYERGLKDSSATGIGSTILLRRIDKIRKTLFNERVHRKAPLSKDLPITIYWRKYYYELYNRDCKSRDQEIKWPDYVTHKIIKE